MQNYVVGFLIDDQNKTVLLIEKDHPDWQKGKLNGIGGKVKEGENSLDAMIREFKEETGLDVTSWTSFCILDGLTLENETFSVHFFYSFSAENIALARKMETEKPFLAFISQLEVLNVIPNLRWLIPMARSMEDCNVALYTVGETY